jgi:predicted RNase H-like HicB family nuclease
MKTLKCDLCDVAVQGKTFEDWMEALKPHYAAEHADVMADPSKTKEDMLRWMAENRARFEAA